MQKHKKLSGTKIRGLLDGLLDETSVLHGITERLIHAAFSTQSPAIKLSEINFQGLIDGHARVGEFIDSLAGKAPVPLAHESEDVSVRLANLHEMLAAVQDEITSIEKLSLLQRLPEGEDAPFEFDLDGPR